MTLFFPCLEFTQKNTQHCLLIMTVPYMKIQIFKISPGIWANNLEKSCFRWGQRKEILGAVYFHSVRFSFWVRTIEPKGSFFIPYYQRAWVVIQPTSGSICNCRWLSWEKLGIVSLTIPSSLNVWTALYLGTFDICVACALCWFSAAYQ